MINLRQAELETLTLLINKKTITLKDLANRLNVSDKTARAILNNVKNVFDRDVANITSKKGSGYTLEIYDEEKFKELVNNHGGLYGRLTYVIKLMPFTLKECEEFFKYNNIELSKYDITQSYMIFGGVPYYLGYFQSDKSLAQNVDSILFKNNANLKNEYNLLFSSIFTNAEEMKDIIKILSSNSIGYSRSEIIDKLKVKGGGVLTKNLEALMKPDLGVSSHGNSSININFLFPSSIFKYFVNKICFSNSSSSIYSYKFSFIGII